MLKFKFDDNGLIPVVIQDEKTKNVLMVAYMNKVSLEKTIKTKRTWFYSRSRKKLWMKGEQSGNVQIVKKIFIDCDNDTILLLVKPKGPACHNGYNSCFYRTGEGKIISKKMFDPEKVYKK
ncbi:MAG: phosphoribosyl-AMP cyclohydrolase [Elusimicrobia bacterium]|nr:phosphoribosyl-AMP cyclohydrolase [Elusimicrobiota bacterium]